MVLRNRGAGGGDVDVAVPPTEMKLEVPDESEKKSISQQSEKKKDGMNNAATSVLATATERSKKHPFWVVDGESYDFTDFIPKHPGGTGFFLVNGWRDISILIHTYHQDPKKLAPLLQKYKITKDHPKFDECTHENLLPKLGAPPFLFDKDYDARKDMYTFDFHNEKHLLNVLRKEVNTKDFQAKVQKANRQFDWTCYLCVATYILNSVVFYFDLLPIPSWVCVIVFILLNTSFGAFGHYYLHGKKPSYGELLFDKPYVGSALAMDGHVQLHHAYTHSGADVKTMFFGAIWELPYLYRGIGYTLHKLGLLLSGMMIRIIEICVVEFDPSVFAWQFYAMRIFMTAEFWMSYATGKLVPFLFAFAGTLWMSTFLVLSSHDFEEFYEDPNGGYHEDWGVFQLMNCHDMTIVGQKHIDMLLSAGLSSHRAHHLFPYQGSGFANIVTEDLIAKHLPDFGLEWHRPKVFWTERAPYVFKFCFMHPTIGMEDMGFLQQHISPTGIFKTVKFILTGFFGINAV